MQIHELNTFVGTPGDTDYIPIDTGFDTAKISSKKLLDPVYKQIDNKSAYKVNQPLDENNEPTDGTPGQILRTNGDGSTEWVDVGLPTDAQTAQAVTDWLDAHPEATTTVADGSIIEDKISPSFLPDIKNEYVSCESTGLDIGTLVNTYHGIKNMNFQEGQTYYTSVPIVITRPCKIDFNKCSIVYSGNVGITDLISISFDSVNGSYIWGNGICNLIADGNSLVNNVIHIKAGKNVTLTDIAVKNPLVNGVLIDQTDGQTWETTLTRLQISATNSGGSAQAEYALKVAAGTDSSFNDLILANGSKAWGYFGCAASIIRGVHGYSYPSTFNVESGFVFTNNGNLVSDIIVDTPTDTGITVTGNYNVFTNLKIGGFTAASNRVGIIDSDGNGYDGIWISSDADIYIKSNATDRLIVKRFINRANGGKDIEFVSGKIPWHFFYDFSGAATDPLLWRYIWKNKYYNFNASGNDFTFTVPFRVANYRVAIEVQAQTATAAWYITNKTKDGFTIHFDTSAMSTGSIRYDVYVIPIFA